MTGRPGYQPLEFIRGDPFDVQFAGQVSGTGDSVNAADALAQIRDSADAVVAEFTVTVEPDVTVDFEGTDIVADWVTCALTSTDTAAIDPGTYRWDFQPSEDENTWMGGPVKVKNDTSRPS